MEPRWRPLLDGDGAYEIRAAIADVASALKTPPPAGGLDPEGAGSQEQALVEEVSEISLERGRAGYALLFDYLAQMGLEPDAGATADAFLDEALDKIPELDLPPSLYMGFLGVAWALQVVQDRAASDEVDPNEEIDDVLSAFLARSPWPGDFDLMSGLVGVGVYALERLPRPAATLCLEQVVERLGELAEHRRDGITWLSRPEILPARVRRDFPLGYYNLGVAHGTPGIISLLGSCMAAGVATDQAAELLEGAVQWLLSTQSPGEPPGSFPALIAPDTGPAPARVAWCYGNPGIACALLVAARGAGRGDWERHALEAGLAALGDPQQTPGIRDAGLCHGSAGVAHLFNRLYQATHVDDFRTAALQWLEHTLRLRRDGHGVAGFEIWKNQRMIAHPGFLQGAAGIALALAAAVGSIEPEWDRALLVSAKPNLP